jgi:hypothetical protein
MLHLRAGNADRNGNENADEQRPRGDPANQTDLGSRTPGILLFAAVTVNIWQIAFVDAFLKDIAHGGEGQGPHD